MRTLTFIMVLFFAFLTVNAQHKYVGAKMCKACHQSEKHGKQFEIWSTSQHAKAFETLKSPAAEKVKKGAAEAKECLECHAVTADAKLTPDGVSCELCHGAGSDYKAMPVMKDHAKAVAAGMVEFKDKAAIEKACKHCHNEKSPTFKGFKFEEMWAKIKHPIPKG